MTAMALEAQIPERRRKIRKAGQLGATAQAIVNIVKKMKLENIMILLPKLSLRGPKAKGPRT